MMQADSRLPGDTLAQGAIPDGSRGCGARLRKSREAAGLTEADVAERLKMPIRVVRFDFLQSQPSAKGGCRQ